MSVDKKGVSVEEVPVEEESSSSSTSGSDMATAEELGSGEEANPKKRKKSNRYAGPDGEAKLKARREANRVHALRSRQRNKQLMHELQQTVVALTRQKTLLEQRNAVLESQVQVLQQQNTMLLSAHGKSSGAASPPQIAPTIVPKVSPPAPPSGTDESLKNMSLLLAATAQQNPHLFLADYTQAPQVNSATSQAEPRQEAA